MNSINFTTYWRKFIGKGEAIPLQAWTSSEDARRLRIWRQSTHEGCQPCALTAFTPQEVFLVLIFLRAESIPEHSAAGRIMSIKNSEPVTFRLVAQCLKQLLHRVPLIFISMKSLLW